MNRRRWRICAARLLNVGALIAFGAFALALYVEATHPSLRSEDLSDKALQAWLLFILLSNSLRPAKWKTPSPAKSGTAVVMATGLVAAGFLAVQNPGDAGIALAVATLALTLALALWVYRFASKNADQIGEARFDTSGTY